MPPINKKALYVYVTDRIEDDVREALLFEFCDRMEIGNSFFEFEDNVVLKNGIGVDIIYRNLNDISQLTSFVLDDAQPMNGYTTCFWHNLVTSQIYFDRSGNLKAAKERFDIPYPEELRKNIIKQNSALLSGKIPSYDRQIMKAISRGDTVSINHRTAAFLESYFDIIFALNRKTHPGEKKLIGICKKECALLPADFEENLNSLLSHLFSDSEKVKQDLEIIVREMNKLLSENGFDTESME